MSASSHQLDQLCINTIRALSIDAVLKANSGHPGLPLGAAPMTYALWDGFLKHSPTNPAWPDRDRFVLSAGHGSMLLYSLLHLTGYDLPLEQIKQFRQWGSITPGHPEHGVTPGIETTTGPLGRALATRWAWPWPNASWPRASIGPAMRSSITTPMPSSVTAT